VSTETVQPAGLAATRPGCGDSLIKCGEDVAETSAMGKKAFNPKAHQGQDVKQQGFEFN